MLGVPGALIVGTVGLFKDTRLGFAVAALVIGGAALVVLMLLPLLIRC